MITSTNSLLNCEFRIETVSDAVKLLKEADDKGLTSGKSPMGIAAAVLYVATLINKEKKTQRDAAKAAGITEVTIRNS